MRSVSIWPFSIMWHSSTPGQQTTRSDTRRACGMVIKAWWLKKAIFIFFHPSQITVTYPTNGCIPVTVHPSQINMTCPTKDLISVTDHSLRHNNDLPYTEPHPCDRPPLPDNYDLPHWGPHLCDHPLLPAHRYRCLSWCSTSARSGLKITQ